jgi:hypothetical protein
MLFHQEYDAAPILLVKALQEWKMWVKLMRKQGVDLSILEESC